ncbi:hypothetical protein IAC76_02590 [Spirochaetes bacterium]|uniref:Uncharacterized protein n=1 Tax=Candidatus Scatousia excrementipullorum TaxID=2840936 RepID=A0A9D9H0A2_9BACT|nr:hypothetical protein [Candidatus Scatousia excrementipullorum]
MKKVLFKLFLSIAICSFGVAVYAETMQVMALSDFSTENPSEYIEVQIYNDVMLDENLSLRSGYRMKAKVVDVVSPKRLKRDAKFSIIPVSYKDFSGVEHPIEKEHVGKYSPKFDIDKGQLAKDAALAVGNHFVKGLSLGYHAVEGAVKNEEGNRLKSSVVSVYESTPLSYANNGEEIVIKKNDFFSFKFKKDKNNKDKDDSEDTLTKTNKHSDSVQEDLIMPEIPAAQQQPFSDK